MKNNGIVFKVNNSTYITPTEEVQEVVQYIPIHEVPLAQSWLLGVMHLRGEVIPVSNLQLFLASMNNQRASQRTNHSKAATLIINHNNWTYGIEVPEIIGMEAIPERFDTRTIEFNIDDVEKPSYIIDSYNNNDGAERTIISLTKLVELNEFINSCRI